LKRARKGIARGLGLFHTGCLRLSLSPPTRPAACKICCTTTDWAPLINWVSLEKVKFETVRANRKIDESYHRFEFNFICRDHSKHCSWSPDPTTTVSESVSTLCLHRMICTGGGLEGERCAHAKRVSVHDELVRDRSHVERNRGCT
jgi:hypothetical protein